jgi:hypothetical protein
MRRVLIVVNQVLEDEQLCRKVTEYVAQGRCQFHVVVPAMRRSTQHRFVWTEGESRALARLRLNETLDRLHAIDADADGHVGDEQPVAAIRDLLSAERFDEILLSTRRPGVSRWLAWDLHHRVSRVFALPVSSVLARPAAAGRVAGAGYKNRTLSPAPVR